MTIELLVKETLAAKRELPPVVSKSVAVAKKAVSYALLLTALSTGAGFFMANDTRRNDPRGYLAFKEEMRATSFSESYTDFFTNENLALGNRILFSPIFPGFYLGTKGYLLYAAANLPPLEFDPPPFISPDGRRPYDGDSAGKH